LADLTLREYVVAEVKPLLPAGWRFIPNQATPDKITVVTVVLKHLEITPSPAAAGALSNEFVLTVLSSLEDDVRAENQLDDDVITVVTALRKVRWCSFQSARKVRDDKTNRLAWDITVVGVTTP
jgi:hypothetical protein